MVRKTYRTFHLKSLDMRFKKKDGTKIEVVFRGGVQIDSTAKFTTSDEELQKKIESTSGFGRDFYIESVEEENAPEVKADESKVVASSPEPKKDLVTIKDSKRFRNFVEMKNAMKEAGLDVKPNWTYAAAQAAAYKQGYDYQISKAEA